MFITFKAIYGLAPSYICKLINIKGSGGYNIRSNEGLLLQAPRFITHTTLGDRALLAATPKLWNSLAVNIPNEENFNTFKMLLKTHFF